MFAVGSRKAAAAVAAVAAVAAGVCAHVVHRAWVLVTISQLLG